MNSSIATPSMHRVVGALADARLRITEVGDARPPMWLSDRALAVYAAVVALSLLAAFHQVVHAGVDRAAARDAAAYRLQAIKAACSTERSAERRSLCQLTTPLTPRAGLRVAAAAR